MLLNGYYEMESVEDVFSVGIKLSLDISKVLDFYTEYRSDKNMQKLQLLITWILNDPFPNLKKLQLALSASGHDEVGQMLIRDMSGKNT